MLTRGTRWVMTYGAHQWEISAGRQVGRNGLWVILSFCFLKLILLCMYDIYRVQYQ